MRWLETLAMGVFAYQETGSAFIVAMLTMLRLLPMGLFGAFLGAAADRLERRTGMIVVVAAMVVTAAVLAVLAHLGLLRVWHLAVACFLNGTAWATDNPVRRLMLGDVVGADRMGFAMSIDVGTNNASRFLGPTLGGLVLAWGGIEAIFTLGAALYTVALGVTLGLRYRNAVVAGAGGRFLGRILEGFSLVRRDRRLVGVLSITVIYNLFGWPFTSMVPVIAHDDLQLGTEGIGVLAGMDGIGSLVGAVTIALVARRQHYGRIYVGGVVLYLASLGLFALAPSPLVAAPALLVNGIGGACFGVMQATLVYLAAPPDMRSRLLGVLSVCIGLGPLGFIHLGLLAEAVGAARATQIMAAEGLLVLFLTRPFWRLVTKEPA